MLEAYNLWQGRDGVMALWTVPKIASSGSRIQDGQLQLLVRPNYEYLPCVNERGGREGEGGGGGGAMCD